MIFNASRGYLFVHIQKTAGTSITQALAGQPGSTFVLPPHLRLRDLRFPFGRRPFTFAVVRNPWERLVSWYAMMRRKGEHNDFSRYLLAAQPDGAPVTFSAFIRRVGVIEEHGDALAHERSFAPQEGLHFRRPGVYLKSLGFAQTDYLTDRWGRFRCDRVLRFEHLHAQWPELVELLHPGAQIDLPHANANPDEALDWREYYAKREDVDWVARLCRKDIRRFGFAFR